MSENAGNVASPSLFLLTDENNQQRYLVQNDRRFYGFRLAQHQLAGACVALRTGHVGEKSSALNIDNG
jgi:hypothetical protein